MNPFGAPTDRRAFLRNAGCEFGAIALAAMLAEEGYAADRGDEPPGSSNFRTGISPRMRSRSMAWLWNSRPDFGPRLRSVVGSITRIRIA